MLAYSNGMLMCLIIIVMPVGGKDSCEVNKTRDGKKDMKKLECKRI